MTTLENFSIKRTWVFLVIQISISSVINSNYMPSFTMTRKSCLVTGCSEGGVGASIAEAFKDKGYQVFATARSPTKIPQSLREAPNVTILSLDVTSSQSITEAAEAIKKQTGGNLDVLINNAGVGLELPALDTPISEARRVFDSNFFAVLEMVQVFSPMLVQAKGCIVNNSSIGGLGPIPFCSMFTVGSRPFSSFFLLLLFNHFLSFIPVPYCLNKLT